MQMVIQITLELLLSILIYPGILFAFIMGSLFWWEFRKLRARFQSRIGPPWYQTFADLIKLFAKETIIPAMANKFIFVFAPIMALSSALVVLWLLPIPVSILPSVSIFTLSFYGDLILIIYLLVMIEVAEILAGFSTPSPYAAIGSSRKVNLVIAYELPFALASIAVAFHVSSLRLSDIFTYQISNGPFILEIPSNSSFGFLAPVFHFITFAVFIICVLPKLRIKPFDIPEAECEIVAGPLTEYSGCLLGIFELANVFKWFIIPALTVILFFGGDLTIITFLIKCALVVFLLTLLETINPRYRIDQGYKFYFKYILPLAIIGFVGETLFALGVI